MDVIWRVKTKDYKHQLTLSTYLTCKEVNRVTTEVWRPIAPLLEKIAKTVARPKHLNQTTFGPLKYLQQTMLWKCFVRHKFKKCFRKKLAHYVAIFGAAPKSARLFKKKPKRNNFAQSGHPESEAQSNSSKDRIKLACPKIELCDIIDICVIVKKELLNHRRNIILTKKRRLDYTRLWWTN